MAQLASPKGATLPLVAVVGRPNVGKSTLVNRLVGHREVIVEDTPGVTRDRLYLEADWAGRTFVAVDTGGLIPDETGDKLLQAVQMQAELAIAEADVVVFLVDGQEGPTAVDMEIASRLRRNRRPVLVAVNKVDNQRLALDSQEFYQLGMGDPLPVSAMHGLGIGELLDAISSQFPPVAESVASVQEGLRLAVVGRPNVGKSSLVNALLGEQRLIVDDQPGTTRDAIDTSVVYEDVPYILIDTAGIRRKSRVAYGIEGFAVVRALKAIARSDVAALVIDAVEGVTAQDQRIGGLILDAGKACVVVVNKWDLVDKDPTTMRRHRQEVLRHLYFLTFAPLIYTSAITRRRLASILVAASAVTEENHRRISTGLLNEVIREAMALNPPPTDRGRALRLNYATQVSVGPPTFVMFVNQASLLPDSYLRYLEGKLRESFGFLGTPLRFVLREKGNDRAKGRTKRSRQ